MVCRVTAASSSNATTGVHYHLGADNFYATSLFTGAAFMKRIADNRSSRDRTYRLRYVVDSSVLSRDPINGYILQRNVPTGQSYDGVYYIYDIQKVQELKAGAQNGIYYLTVLNGRVTPSDSNLTGFSFSQNINNLYPTLDKDNPLKTLRLLHLWHPMLLSVWLLQLMVLAMLPTKDLSLRKLLVTGFLSRRITIPTILLLIQQLLTSLHWKQEMRR